MKISAETNVHAPIDQVWRAYTSPADIKQWNAASDDWHTTAATVDLRVGGSFSSRMEAKDGSFGFDFAGTYTRIDEQQRIEYAFGDRTAQVEFLPSSNGIVVRVTFDSEQTHSIEQQREGWQAILDRFARHVESQKQIQSTLDVIYENWQGYQQKLADCIAPLTHEQLSLQPAPHLWPLGQIVQHIISVRAGWFSGTLQDEDQVMQAYMDWGQRESPARSAAELVRGLNETWAFIEVRLQRWTPAECAVTFPDEWDGQIFEVSRSWVIYHVMEHDLHHGGEVSLILGMNGLQTLAL